MTTLGVSSASYHASTSIQRSDRLNAASVEKISRARESIADGDSATFAAMDNTLKLDVAGTGAALKSMVVAQGYLTTALTSLDNATDILTRMQELAVAGANGTNSAQNSIDIDMEAEALADAFHLALSTANYKGRKIFNEDDGVLTLSYGGRGAAGDITQTAFDYDNFYDYKNPNTSSLLAGVGYEVTRELSALEAQTILSRTTGLSEEDLVVGFQFNTNVPPAENVGAGIMNVLDDAGDGNLRTYNNGDSAVRIDPSASILGAEDFDYNGGYIDFEITENFETTDTLSISGDGANLRIDADGIIEFNSSAYNQWIEIGSVDEQRNGENGSPLRVNLFADATVPGTSDIANGDFSQTTQVITNYTKDMDNVNRTETRSGVVGSFQQADGTAIASPGTPTSGDFTNITPTGGSGTGLRVSLQIDNTQSITGIDILDAGEGYAAGDRLTYEISAGVSVQFDVSTVQDNVVTILTEARTSNISQDVLQTSSGSYDFDATGRPLSDGGGPALTFEINDVVQESVRRTRQVAADTPEFDDFGNRTNDVTEVYYTIQDDTETIGSTYTGERNLTDSVWNGTYNETSRTVPLNWTAYEDRVDFGNPFVISEFANGADDTVVTNANGDRSADTSGRVEFSVPTPSEAVMAATLNGPGNDDVSANSSDPFDPSVTVVGGELSLNQENFLITTGYGIVHGPAAVSDAFSAQAGDFLKFDYTANFGGDNYHVAGYIYEVDDNGVAVGDPIIALNETGVTGGGRASVEVPTDGQYRFVFVNGTYDENGLRGLGASMTIDNIVAEDPYSIEQDAVEAVVQAIAFAKTDGATTSNDTKILTATLQNADQSSIIRNDTNIQIEGFDATLEADGPYSILPTYDLVVQPSAAQEGASDILTSKIEAVHEQLRMARVEVGASYTSLEAAIENVTDLRSQYTMGSNTISDLNFVRETAHLSKRRIQNDVATAMLAQANKAQEGILSLVDNSYR
jgi:flagellin-like hook-associated protein FlgL